MKIKIHVNIFMMENKYIPKKCEIPIVSNIIRRLITLVMCCLFSILYSDRMNAKHGTLNYYLDEVSLAFKILYYNQGTISKQYQFGYRISYSFSFNKEQPR